MDVEGTKVLNEIRLKKKIKEIRKGKFGVVFASIPAPIVAGLYCLFFAYVGSAGLRFLWFCNLNSFRIKFILGFSIFMGLSIPQYFNEYTAIKGYGPVHTKARWVRSLHRMPSSRNRNKLTFKCLMKCLSEIPFSDVDQFNQIMFDLNPDVDPIVALFSPGAVGVSSFSNCYLKQLIRMNNPSIVMNVALILWRNNETICNQGQLWNKVEDDVVSNRLGYWRWLLKWRFDGISLWQQIAVYTLKLICDGLKKELALLMLPLMEPFGSVLSAYGCLRQHKRYNVGVEQEFLLPLNHEVVIGIQRHECFALQWPFANFTPTGGPLFRAAAACAAVLEVQFWMFKFHHVLAIPYLTGFLRFMYFRNVNNNVELYLIRRYGEPYNRAISDSVARPTLSQGVVNVPETTVTH
ncbi:hypothetical protein LXL04_016107 [Taraxacum kok-saghyz]